MPGADGNGTQEAPSAQLALPPAQQPPLGEVLSSGLPRAGSCLASSNWIFPAAFSLAAQPGAGSLLMRSLCQRLGSSIPLGRGWFGPAQGSGQLPRPTGARTPGAALSACSPCPAWTSPPPVPGTRRPPRDWGLPGPPLFRGDFAVNERISPQGTGSLDFCPLIEVARQPGEGRRPLLGLPQGPPPPAQTLPEAAGDAPHVASF